MRTKIAYGINVVKLRFVQTNLFQTVILSRTLFNIGNIFSSILKLILHNTNIKKIMRYLLMYHWMDAGTAFERTGHYW